jgi:MFS family permease
VPAGTEPSVLAVAASPANRSYRALLAVPTLGRILLAMEIARIGQSMVAIAMVLFTLVLFHSPVLAGLVTFATTFPGIVASPIAGALLDRHGRTRLVTLNYVVAATALAFMSVLATEGLLTPWLLLLIAALASLTAPLSSTGLRSLFPIIVPQHLWERANAADSVGYVAATIVGAPLSGFLVGFWGPEPALLLIAGIFAVAAIVVAGLQEPRAAVASTGRLWVDAWQGLVYTWHNRTLRALGFSISSLGLSGGVNAIVIPLIVLGRLHLGPAVVGIVFACQGLGGVLAALLAGRLDTTGRERRMIVLSAIGSGLAFSLLIPDAGPFLVLGAMVLLGTLNGPSDIAMFTLRQRRTDPRWIGRAFAVSMALNSLGTPIGAALGGILAGSSLPAAVSLGVVGCFLGALFAHRLIPDQA